MESMTIDGFGERYAGQWVADKVRREMARMGFKDLFTSQQLIPGASIVSSSCAGNKFIFSLEIDFEKLLGKDRAKMVPESLINSFGLQYDNGKWSIWSMHYGQTVDELTEILQGYYADWLGSEILEKGFADLASRTTIVDFDDSVVIATPNAALRIVKG